MRLQRNSQIDVVGNRSGGVWRRIIAVFTAMIVAAGMLAATGVSASAVPATGSISGTVTVTGGATLGGVYVTVTKMPDYQLQKSDYNNFDGTYSFDNLTPGDYEVRFGAQYQGYEFEYWNDSQTRGGATLVTVSAGADTPNISPVLTIGASISGNVKTAGSPAANIGNVQVSASVDWNLGAAPGNSAFTDSAGNFTILGLSEGTYTLHYSAGNTALGFSDAPPAYDVPLARYENLTGMDAILPVGGRLTGKVTGADNPLVGIPGIGVRLQGSPDVYPGANGYATTDSDGNYTINNIQGGPVRLDFEVPYNGSLNYIDKSVTMNISNGVMNNKSAILDVGGIVTGNVTHAGAPAADVYVGFYDGDTWFEGGQTDVNGDYSARRLPAGSYNVSFVDYASSTETALATKWWPNSPAQAGSDLLEVGAGAVVPDINADLGDGSTISGSLSVDSGTVSGTWVVMAWDAATGDRLSARGETNANGSYVLGALPIGTYKVGVYDRSANSGDSTDDRLDEDGNPVGLNFNVGYADLKSSLATANAITVTAPGQSLTGHDVHLTTKAAPNQYVSSPIPTLSGLPRAGNVLVSDIGAWSVFPMATYEWLRDGVVIASEYGENYRVRSSDVGHSIAVRITTQRPGYEVLERTSTAVPVPVGLDFVTVAPTIAGTAQVGQTLTATTAAWTPAATSVAYQWSAGGVEIPLATGATYDVAPADFGKKLTVASTGTKAGYIPTTVSSAETLAVTVGSVAAGTPTITGTAEVGQTLTANPVAAGWTPSSGLAFTYQWQANGSVIVGATSSTFTPTVAHGTKTVSVVVTGTAPGFESKSATSGGVVITQEPLISATPVISGSPVVDGALTADAGTWGPTGVALSYQWAVAGVDVAGETSASYSPVVADLGMTVSVRVTGSLATYVSVTKSSVATAAVAPGAITAAIPTVSGSTTVGQTLTANANSAGWAPSGLAFSYQWNADGAPIARATTSTLVLAAGQIGKTITVTVTGSTLGYTPASATSAATVAVAAMPILTGVPTVSGVAQVGKTLTANANAAGWTPSSGVEFTYQWNAAGNAIAGATSDTLVVASAQVGETITVTITGSKADYTAASVTSVATAAVAAGSVTAGAPTISGTAAVGQTLTANANAAGWTPSTGLFYTYQWLANGTAIVGATTSTFTPTAAQGTKTVSVKVTGTAPGFEVKSATSSGVTITQAPLVSATPLITGSPVVGGVLTANAGAWGPSGVALTYQWAVGGNDVAGAHGSTYSPVLADLGKSVSVTVTGSLATYVSVSKTSAATAAVVAAVVPIVAGTPTVSGTAKGGQTLTADANAAGWTPSSGVAFTYQWNAAGAPIAGATSSTLTLAAAQTAKKITVTVTGAKSGFSAASATSTATAAVVPGDVVPDRISGSDRYDTAAKVAQEWQTASVVYISTGLIFADALSAGPAAAFKDAPLLLTPPTSLSGAAKTELLRLHPTEIIIVGGTGVVSAAVEAELEALAFTPAVRRIGGSDRYETSRMLAADTFTAGGAATAYLADGSNFPDALTASPAASDFRGPVILVPGRASAVDAATTSLLGSLGVTKVKIAGGSGVVSAAIETQLRGTYGASNVKRNSGGDRYSTAVAINADQFTTEDVVYLATGTGFADALAGAALAGRNGAPLFITQSNCIPASVMAAITDLGATSVVLLGGPGVLSSAVENMQTCR